MRCEAGTSSSNVNGLSDARRLGRPLERHPTHRIRLFLQTIQGQRQQSRGMAMNGQRIPCSFKSGDVGQNDNQWGHSVRLASTADARIAIAVNDQSSGTTSEHRSGGRICGSRWRSLYSADAMAQSELGTASLTLRHSPENTSYSAAIRIGPRARLSRGVRAVTRRSAQRNGFTPARHITTRDHPVFDTSSISPYASIANCLLECVTPAQRSGPINAWPFYPLNAPPRNDLVTPGSSADTPSRAGVPLA